jgi:hypothetical protein
MLMFYFMVTDFRSVLKAKKKGNTSFICPLLSGSQVFPEFSAEIWSLVISGFCDQP